MPRDNVVKVDFKTSDCLKDRCRMPQFQGAINQDSLARLLQGIAITAICESCEKPSEKIHVTLYPTRR